MSYFKDIEESKFVSCIRENYDFLIDEYGFVYESNDSREHHYRSERCRISIFYYRYELDISISPRKEGLEQIITKERFSGKDVGLVAFQFGADGPTRLSDAHVERLIVAELELRAKQVIEYCKPFLQGDFSTWPAHFRLWTVDPEEIRHRFEGLSFDEQYDLYWNTPSEETKYLDTLLQGKFMKEKLRRKKEGK